MVPESPRRGRLIPLTSREMVCYAALVGTPFRVSRGGGIMRRSCVPGGLVLLALALGCHHEVEMIPLAERTIYSTDRFYDVQAISKDHAVVVGYGGKILSTTDAGNSWEILPSGTDLALYAVHFTDAQHGFISGQDGVILHTEDGGKSWQKQESNAIFQDKDGSKQSLFLFGLYALDNDHAWAVGDRSILTSTSDGGKTWRARKVQMEADISGGESLAAADPILYDVKFTDAQNGWIVGEFGKIMHTSDGGETWHEQEKTLLEGTGIFDLLDLPTMFGISVVDDKNAVAVGLEGRGRMHVRDQQTLPVGALGLHHLADAALALPRARRLRIEAELAAFLLAERVRVERDRLVLSDLPVARQQDHVSLAAE